MLVDVARVWAPGRSLGGRHTSWALTSTTMPDNQANNARINCDMDHILSQEDGITAWIRPLTW
jgi:hypothetical protein